MNQNTFSETCLDFEKKIKKTRTRDKKIDLYTNYIAYTYPHDVKKTIEIIDKAYLLSLESKSTDRKYIMKINKAMALRLENKFEEALRIYLDSMDYFYLYKPDQYFFIIYNIANIFLQINQFGKANSLYAYILENYSEKIDLVNFLKMKNAYFVSLYKMETKNIDLLEFDTVETLYNTESLKNSSVYAHFLLTKALFLARIKRHPEALKIIEEALAISLKFNYEQRLFEIFGELALIYKEINHFDKMIDFLERQVNLPNIDIFHKMDAQNYYELINYYKSKEDYKKAFYYLEFYNKVKLEQTESSIYILKVIENIQFDDNIKASLILLNNFLIKDKNSSANTSLIFEGTKGQIVKINFNQIVSIVSNYKFIG